MELPSFFVVQDIKIYTFGFFLAFGALLAAFVFWQEGRRDGFDEEKLLDLYLISLVFGIFTSRIAFALAKGFPVSAVLSHAVRFWTDGTNIAAGVLGFLVAVFVLVKRWKWSVFRAMDILSLSFSLGMGIVSLGFVALQKDFRFLFVFAAYLLSFALLSTLRVSKFKSGFVFSIFLLLNIGIWLPFHSSYADLIFYGVLFTISQVNLIARGKKYMEQIDGKRKLPANLLANLKKALLSKRKRLEEEEKLLVEEDPYLKEGRASDNAEEADDVMLEDVQKEITDLKKSSVSKMLSQVKRALASMRIGKYGICEECGEHIDKARLKAYPEATTCAKCSHRGS